MQTLTRIIPSLLTRRTRFLASTTSRPLSSPLFRYQSNMSAPFLEAISKRRTFYQISNALPEGLTEDKIQNILKQIVLNVPSSFNSQVFLPPLLLHSTTQSPTPHPTIALTPPAAHSIPLHHHANPPSLHLTTHHPPSSPFHITTPFTPSPHHRCTSPFRRSPHTSPPVYHLTLLY